MIIDSRSNGSNTNNLLIKFNSNYKNQATENGNGLYKSQSFDYQQNLLNKKRKLENDLKCGNIKNFHKVLNNAVTNSNRNNDNELIPNKIEFKLSHVLKGEKRISEEKIDVDSFLHRNDSQGQKIIKNRQETNFDLNNNIIKHSDSDNNSDLTKTSSHDEIKKYLSIDKLEKNPASIISNFERKSSNSFVEMDHGNELDSLRNVNLKSSKTKIADEDKPISRKNSCISNTSDKNPKSHKGHIFHDAFVDSLLEWKKPTHVGSGLNNMGNTCFLNSVLQTLLYTPGLINYFYASEHKKKCSSKGICLLCEFSYLIELSKTSKINSLTPKNILNNLRFISKNIKIGRQEDAHEFLLYFLDGLEKSCKNFVNSTKSNFIVSNQSNEDNLIQKLFGGKLASCVICLKCKNISKKFDQYLDISIDIYNSESIHRSLKNFCRPESLSGSNKFYCENCKTKNDSLKKFSYENFPRVLVLHLKRFDNFQRKIKKFIEYPVDLDLSNFSENKKEKYKYKLYAVLVHEGSTISWGHYYCYIRNSNDLWYCMNDSHVSESSLKTVLNQTPYLLFYERVLEKKPQIIRKNSIDSKNDQIKTNKSNIINIKKTSDFKNMNNNNSSTNLLKSYSIGQNIVDRSIPIKLNIDKTNNEKSVGDSGNNLNKMTNGFDNKMDLDIKKYKSAEIRMDIKEKIESNFSVNKVKSLEEKNTNKNIFIKPKGNFKDLNENNNNISGINEILNKILPKEDEEKQKNIQVNLDLIRNKNSFERKIYLCDKIDMKENYQINKKLLESVDLKQNSGKKYSELITEVNTRSKSKPMISKNFKRLLSIYSKFGNNSDRKQTIGNSFFNQNSTSLPLNETKNEEPIKNKIKFDIQRKEENLESEIKKRICNTKINEVYCGQFIERWEDEENDEKELEKLRKQAEFIRRAEAFKKQKILKKSEYDIDYDTGKQKKVRIYDEKDSKGKNVFQKVHSGLLKKNNIKKKF